MGRRHHDGHPSKGRHLGKSMNILPIVLALSLPFPAEMKQSSADVSRVRVMLANRIAKREIPGVVSMVFQSGRVVMADAQGFADVDQKIPMAQDTMFQVWSMTKPVTAAAAVIAAEQGYLVLDEPVEKYLPAFKTVKVKTPSGEFVSPVKKPTIRHMLSHTSGLGSADPGGMSDEQKFALTLPDYAKLLGKDPLQTQPGTEINYSGVGINIVAAIIEMTVPQKSFEKFVQTQIFDKLSMKDTHFFLPTAKQSRLAKGYSEWKDGKWVEFEHDRFRKGAKFANGAGGLYSTAGDMGKFINSFLPGANPTVVTPAGIRTMTTIQSGNLLMDGDDARGFGLGFSIVRGAAGQAYLNSVGAFGHTGAFGTEFWADPSGNYSAVFMVQGLGLSDAPRKSFKTMVNAMMSR